MSAVVDNPAGLYSEMYDSFSWDAYADRVDRVPANSFKDPGLLHALEQHGAGTILFTGGGIIPAAVFGVPGIKLIHVHTGFLPHVRGADVLLWSLLVRGRPGVSAFTMTPGLDDGDVLAARELDPLRIPRPGRVDDDTLYRAIFSFIDPLIRAELLVADVLEPARDVADLTGSPQDLDQGITYHFMHPALHARGLRALFVPGAEDRSSGTGASKAEGAVDPTTAKGPSPAKYQKFYKKVSTRAPIRFAMDAAKAKTGLRAQSLRNRQKDYAGLQANPKLLSLHAELNRQLAEQTEHWDSYDYGEGYFYQSSDELGITGLRDTSGRVAAFDLRNAVEGRTVLEIGCNTGFLTLAIAPKAERIVAFELNPYLIAMANAAKSHLGIENVDFDVAAFEDFAGDTTYDDVLSFANHHTYDGNTHQSLEEYFERCHALTKPGGRLIFESHPPELEGDQFGSTVEIINHYYAIDTDVVHEYGTFLDKGRHFIVGTRR